MKPCQDREPMLQALLDGELDAANALAVESHLKTCMGCADHFRAMQAVRDRLAEGALVDIAPERLRARIELLIDGEERRASRSQPSRRPWWAGVRAAWGSAGAMAAVAAALLMVQVSAPPDMLESQLVASHVRSLQGGHLIDVATSDRHVVRPWFNGRIDYAPPVPDLADQGFPLAGGRLDYAEGQNIAALIYRRRAHVINLFVLPERPPAWRLPFAPEQTPPGYAVVHWRDRGLEYWAVSDVEGDELGVFRDAFRAHEESPSH